MNNLTKRRHLTLALRVVGLVFIFGVYPLTVVWPAGWSWHAGQSEYLQMIIAIYATLGAFLLFISANPDQHLGLISFTIWSSVVHGGVMAAQSLADTQHVGHLYGDVPALFIVAALLAWLCPSAAMLKLDAVAA